MTCTYLAPDFELVSIMSMAFVLNALQSSCCFTAVFLVKSASGSGEDVAAA